MATIHGSDGVIKVGSGFAALGQIQNWSLDVKADVLEGYSMGEAWKSAKSGVRSWSGSVECYFDAADAGQGEITAGDTVAVNFYPAGEATGSKYYSGTVVVMGAPVSAEKDGFVLQSFSFKGSGELSTGALS